MLGPNYDVVIKTMSRTMNMRNRIYTRLHELQNEFNEFAVEEDDYLSLSDTVQRLLDAYDEQQEAIEEEEEDECVDEPEDESEECSEEESDDDGEDFGGEDDL